MTDYYSLLQRKINAIRADPNQSRRVVYDLARYALKNKAFAHDPTLTTAQIAEQLRALEAAIARLEANAQNGHAKTNGGRRVNTRRDEEVPASDPAPSSPSEADFDVVRQPPRRASHRRDLVVLPPNQPSRYGRDADFPDAYHPPAANSQLTLTPETAALIHLLAQERNSTKRRAMFWFDGVFRLVVIALIALGGYAIWSGKLSELAGITPPPSRFAEVPAAESILAPTVPFVPTAKSPASSFLPEMNLPKVYGVYAVYNDRLITLEKVPTEAVDPRKPNLRQITTPSRSVFPDGRVSFTVYQRDLANSAPITVPIRFASTIASTMKFGPGGTLVTVKPEVETWLIHTAGFDFRVLPVQENQEMILIRPDDPDSVLPPGRYVLMLNEQPYDFSVAGNVTDPRACVEGTVTNRGPVFYECRPPDTKQ
jgi:hypothetical protein